VGAGGVWWIGRGCGLKCWFLVTVRRGGDLEREVEAVPLGGGTLFESMTVGMLRAEVGLRKAFKRRLATMLLLSFGLISGWVQFFQGKV